MLRPQISEIRFTSLILNAHELEGSETNEFWIQASIRSEEHGKNSLLKWNWDLPLKFPLVRLLRFEDGDSIFFRKVDKKLQS
jgi:hypothetical protein